VDVTSATIDLRLEDLESTTSGSGVSLSSVGGQFRAPSGSAITKSSGGGTAFAVTNSSAAVNYAGTLNVTSGAGVGLSNNTGAANFTGQLTLNTGANAAFSATGANGTVTATHAANTLTTTTGTALTVNGPDIGVGGMVFTSIAANGAPNGIVLQDTGTTAGLTVSGTGGAGSGGTIQNITNRGASFVNAINISLSDMNFTNANTTDGATSDGSTAGNQNTDENGAIHLQGVTQVDLTDLVITTTAQHGINGNNVTDLDITNATITATGNEVWESGIYLFNLKGLASASRTNVFSNVDISNSGQFNLAVINNDGTNDPPGEKDRLELVSDCDFADSGQQVIGDHITILNSGSAAGVRGNFQIVVTGASFTSDVGCPASPAGACTSDGIQVDASESASYDASISTSTFTNAGQAAINLSGSGNGTGTFSVMNNNPISVRAGTGINVSLAAANDGASLRGTISGNNISTNVTNNAGFGIGMLVNDEGALVIDVNNNQINGNGSLDFDYGIRGGSRVEDSTADFTVNNNTVQSAEVAGVWFFSGNATAGETSRTCVNFVSNLIDGDPVDAFTDYFVEMYTGTTFQIQGLTGSGTNATNVQNFIAATDDDPSPTDPTVDAGSGTTVNYTNAICQTP
jgi:hypothetical protein